MNSPLEAQQGCESIVAQLHGLRSEKNREGMARYGINVEKAFGVSIQQLRPLAREYRGDHLLALHLWETGFHEARLLACLIDDPGQVTEAQMDRWVTQVDSWDLCDQLMSKLIDKTPHAYQKAEQYSGDERQFVKRAGFALMASLAVHDKAADDDAFHGFLERIEERCEDERNFVRKAVNWALRQIGKRNLALNKEAIDTAERIREMDSRAARWIAADALRELTSEKIRTRLSEKVRYFSGENRENRILSE